jgi:ferric-dicitrate binding protein FerR (iron transport regulator)
MRHVQYNLGWLAGRRASIAAGILLAIGLTLGFAMGRAGTDKPTGAKVPMRVAKLDGTVLVKHEGLDAWQVLETDSTIHLGDMFHSATRSGFVLEMEDKSTIEVNQNSMLVLKLYNGQTQFFLEYGRCTAALESPHPPFFIRTPHGRVEALGTEFTVTVE